MEDAQFSEVFVSVEEMAGQVREPGSGFARSFRDLRAYQLARAEAGKIVSITTGLPDEEKYGLALQIRRSARAVGALIAEAWARRRYEKSFVSKLIEAQGEAMETQSWLDHALDSGYIEMDDYNRMDAAWQAIGGMLQRMIDLSSSFCEKTRD
jgi:four helix bundle protein